MGNCQGCGAVHSEEALSCGACGRILAIPCPQCTVVNPASLTLCRNCGRTITAPSGTSGPPLPESAEPIAQMISRPSPKSEPDRWPKNPFLKIVVGGFVFGFLYLSQALGGFPVVGILAGLASVGLLLWGIIDLFRWELNRRDQVAFPAEDLEPGPLPGLDQRLVGEEGSFEELEREVAGPRSDLASSLTAGPTSEVARPTPGPESLAPDALFTSMVAAGDRPTEREKPHQTEAGSPETPRDAGAAEEDALADFEDGIDLPRRDRRSQTLAEFLDDGLAQEISTVQKKIDRSPANFSLLMRLAQLYEERGELANALLAMKKCIAFSPQAAEVFLYYGVLLRRSGEMEEARTALERAVSLNRFLSKAHYQMGILERGCRNLPAARDALQKCIQLTPDDAYAHYQLGMVYRELGDLDLALMELKRACQLHPSDSYGHSQLGQIYEQACQFDQALAEYSRALSLKPNDSFVLERLAELMVKRGEIQKAQDLFQEALAHQFHPEPRTMVSLAKILNKRERFGEMKAVAEEILRLVPNHPDGLHFLALACLSEKDVQRALELFDTLTKTAPERWEAWMELGKLFQSLGQDQDAITAFTKASANATDQAGIWNTIGILLTNRKDFPEALKAFKKAAGFDYSDAQIQSNLKAVQKKIDSTCQRVIEANSESLAKDPNQLDAYLEMGRAYELLERPEEALMAYQRLLSLRPDSVDGLMAYAELLKKRGRLKMAIRCYREILKIQHNHIEARLELVKANLNLGFLNEALRHAVVAQKSAPDDPRVHFLLGKIYFSKGLAPRALKEFTFVANHSRDPDIIGWAELMRRRLQRSV